MHVRIITPEDRPLGLFGAAASDAVERLLDEAQVALDTSCTVVSMEPDGLHVAPRVAGPLAAERVVTLAKLSGPSISGLPVDGRGSSA